MAITFDRKNSVFRIENAKLSYVFFVNKKGVLQHLYFGKKIGETDLSSTDLGWDWSKTYLTQDGDEKIYEDCYYNDRSMAEVSSHGLIDKAGARRSFTSGIEFIRASPNFRLCPRLTAATPKHWK